MKEQIDGILKFGLNITIDGSTFTNMNCDDIKEFFDGLTKLIGMIRDKAIEEKESPCKTA